MSKEGDLSRRVFLQKAAGLLGVGTFLGLTACSNPDNPNQTPIPTSRPTAIPTPPVNGLWVNPDNGAVQTNPALWLAARAHGDETIQKVEFTGRWPGSQPSDPSEKNGPTTLVSVSRPLRADLYEATADLLTLGIPPGNVTLGFNVYANDLRRTNPDGIRVIHYQPNIQGDTK